MIICFSLLLFQRNLNAFLYDLYHEIAHILTFPCHNRYIYSTTNTNRVIKSFEAHLSKHRDPLSILKSKIVVLAHPCKLYVYMHFYKSSESQVDYIMSLLVVTKNPLDSMSVALN